MLILATLLDDLEQLAPPTRAADWDNVGLLLGDRAAEVQRVMTCLTVTPECTAEAIERGVQLIVSHHPILFRGVKRLTGGTPEGKMLLDLVRRDVAVYSPHTAFDNTVGGINEKLAQRLDMTACEPLRAEPSGRMCKLVVFVPDADLEKVSTALFNAGAGQIGEYRECSYRLNGTGTFFATEAANPTVGTRGRREEVPEWRLEVVCPESRVERVVTAMRQAHSYEEPAFDVYPLRVLTGRHGSGRVGRLSSPLRLEDLGRRVRESLRCGPVQLIGDVHREVERVAIVCGAGGELFQDAVKAHVDVFLTGEMRFHDYLSAQQHGVALCLPGHYATERFAVEELAVWLQGRYPQLEVFASRKEADPVHWV